jgi:hypothetical protein
MVKKLKTSFHAAKVRKIIEITKSFCKKKSFENRNSQYNKLGWVSSLSSVIGGLDGWSLRAEDWF